MATRIRLRYDSLEAWNGNQTTLLPGEFGVAKHQDGTIEVRVGNGEPGTNDNTAWADAPQISGAGTIIDGFDFTNLTVGDIIYWNGTGWDSASLSERIKGSGNIFLTEDNDGVLTINYGVATWNPTFTPVSIALVEIRRVYGPTNTVLTVSCGSSGTSVRNASATIKSVNNQNYTNFADIPVTLTNGTGSGTISNLTIPNNVVEQASSFSYSTLSTRRSEIQCLVTAQNETIGGQPYTGTSSDTLEVYVNFGWRFAGFVSPTDFSDNLIGITQMANPGSFDAIVQTPPSTTSTIERTWTIAPGQGEQYLYFAHSANGAGSSDIFNWSPKFLDSANQIEPFVEITDNETTNGGDTSTPNLQYRVWRSPFPLAPGSYTLKIQKL